MWVAKIRLKHDCIIANRCAKFKVLVQSLELNKKKENDIVITFSIHRLAGEQENIVRFVNDLKNDKRTDYVELNGNTIFLIESSKGKVISKFTGDMFFVKPVAYDTEGYEYWEVASHKKDKLMNFIHGVKPLVDFFELRSIKDTPLQSIYFPKVMPELTILQKRAIELAIEEGYYKIPKKTSLRKLAKLMKISLATYQKHLQKAECKIIPDALS